MGWLAPGGLLLVLMEKSDSSCMRMVEHFTGTRFDLCELADELRAQATELVGGVRLETVTARYRTEDLDEAVADFHLSVPSDPDRDGVDGSSPNAPVSRKAVEDYVRSHFHDLDGGYTISNDQHALHIHRPRP
ncbi:hypothetical protein ABZ383_08445 [Streptomyces sp. NPDC005900]|uniref:hypothetical protein n=1 Tax=Streptomyces sp. NPDC005900 TaxID=3154569 RepID=UPI0033FA48E4